MRRTPTGTYKRKRTHVRRVSMNDSFAHVNRCRYNPSLSRFHTPVFTPPHTYRAIACRAAHSAAGESACRPLSKTLARPSATTAASLSRVLAREDWLGARPPCPTAAAPSRFFGGITGVDVSVCMRVCMHACACDTAVSCTLAIFRIPKSPPDLKETRRTRKSTRRVYDYELAMAYTVNIGKSVPLALDV